MAKTKVDVLEQLKGIRKQLSKLIASGGSSIQVVGQKALKANVTKVGPIHLSGQQCLNVAKLGPIHSSGQNCFFGDFINAPENLVDALKKIDRWLGYIIKVLEPKLKK